MNKISFKVAVLTLLIALFVGCAPQGQQAAEQAVSEATLTISSPQVNVTWSLSDLQAFPTIDVEYTNKDGETTIYNGVALSTLLEEAGIESYKSLSLVAADGYTAEVTSDELAGCTNCIIAFDDESLRSIMPDMSGKLQVKNLVEIQITQ